MRRRRDRPATRCRPNANQRRRARYIDTAARRVGGRSALHGLPGTLVEAADGPGDDIVAERLAHPIPQGFEVGLLALNVFETVGEARELGRELLLLRQVLRPAIGETVSLKDGVDYHHPLAPQTRLA